MAPPSVQELLFPHLHIPITIDQMTRVKPSGPIPVAFSQTLYLSNLDDMVGARVFTPTVYFYSLRDRRPVMKTLHDALASVLVPYYPLSGRLREARNGKLEVFFGQEQGALLVEAHSEMALADLGDLKVPNPEWTPLICRFQNEEPYKVLDMPLVIAQVTHFSCGGISIGLRICHCLCGGLGAMQFLSAWAATAKSGTLVTIVTIPEPCWDREFFSPREPPLVKFPHIEFRRIEDGSSLTNSLWQIKPVQKCYRISREFQLLLKALTQPKQDNNHNISNVQCSTFDAMAAHVWSSWVKALNVKPLNYALRLTFSANGRHRHKNPPLKEGFYGNAVCLACVTSTVTKLIYSRLSEISHLVREARTLGISEEYLRSTVDYVQVDRPRKLEFGGKLTITQWTRFPIYDSADFGWGRPIYAGPIDLTPTPQVCVFLPEAEADRPSETMLICICLPESATFNFTQLLSLANSGDSDHVKCNIWVELFGTLVT